MIIGIIGSKYYTSRKKIKEFLVKAKLSFPEDLTILSGGTLNGAERYVKEVCQELWIPYKEYNPAYTPINEHSALGPAYYGKQFHGSQPLHRYFMLVDRADVLVVCSNTARDWNVLKPAYERAKKANKKVAVLV